MPCLLPLDTTITEVITHSIWRDLGL